jgi:hypothetical protein
LPIQLKELDAKNQEDKVKHGLTYGEMAKAMS